MEQETPPNACQKVENNFFYLQIHDKGTKKIACDSTLGGNIA